MQFTLSSWAMLDNQHLSGMSDPSCVSLALRHLKAYREPVASFTEKNI